MDVEKAQELLAALDAATSLQDLSPLRSVGLHKLTGNRKGQWAMTVTGPWRICFRFRDGDAWDVEISDYHRGWQTMTPIHPGRILRRELEARGQTATQLALALRVPSGRITSILKGKRSVTPETALRLARYFGNTPQFWMNLQTRFDLIAAEQALGERISSEVKPAA
jgi:addiction module HigA family antidote